MYVVSYWDVVQTTNSRGSFSLFHLPPPPTPRIRGCAHIALYQPASPRAVVAAAGKQRYGSNRCPPASPQCADFRAPSQRSQAPPRCGVSLLSCVAAMRRGVLGRQGRDDQLLPDAGALRVRPANAQPGLQLQIHNPIPPRVSFPCAAPSCRFLLGCGWILGVGFSRVSRPRVCCLNVSGPRFVYNRHHPPQVRTVAVADDLRRRIFQRHRLPEGFRASIVSSGVCTLACLPVRHDNNNNNNNNNNNTLLPSFIISQAGNALSCQQRLSFARTSGYVSLLNAAAVFRKERVNNSETGTEYMRVSAATNIVQNSERTWTLAVINTVRASRACVRE